ncbi:MAG: hypothetical protein EYC68_22205 [Chloroflexota bacterium]|nr:MAG: hypothetical protein EYC68_22205 [Chloroflexota bacterium]
MIELTTILLAIAGLGIGAIIAIYTLNKLKSWLRGKIGNWQNNRVLAGAFKQYVENGNYRVYPLITDISGKHILAMEGFEAEELDADLHRAFGDKNLIQIDNID